MLSELLAAKPLAKDAAAAQIGHIRDSAKRLTEMVDTLIADAMSDALDIQIRKEPIDLGALVAEVAGANRTLADRKEQTIKVGKAPEVSLLGDHDRLAEAIDNLISNAIKYSPKGAAIDVAVARRRGQASIRVKDKGPGLSREDMSRLFGRFQRLSARADRRRDLDRARPVDRQAHRRAPRRHDRGRERGSGQGRGLRDSAAYRALGRAMSVSPHIFVVDDEAAARDMVGDYLKLHGFKVTLCDGGASLRQCLAKDKPDLIVLDLNMPEEDGLSIVRDLKKIDQRAGHHADRDREPDRPRRRPRARRRRLSGKAVRAARARGAHPLGHPPGEPGGGRRRPGQAPPGRRSASGRSGSISRRACCRTTTASTTR